MRTSRRSRELTREDMSGKVALEENHDVHYDFPLMQLFLTCLLSSTRVTFYSFALSGIIRLISPSRLVRQLSQRASSHGRTKIMTTWCGSASSQSGTCVRRRKVVCASGRVGEPVLSPAHDVRQVQRWGRAEAHCRWQSVAHHRGRGMLAPV